MQTDAEKVLRSGVLKKGELKHVIVISILYILMWYKYAL